MSNATPPSGPCDAPLLAVVVRDPKTRSHQTFTFEASAPPDLWPNFGLLGVASPYTTSPEPLTKPYSAERVYDEMVRTIEHWYGMLQHNVSIRPAMARIASATLNRRQQWLPQFILDRLQFCEPVSIERYPQFGTPLYVGAIATADRALMEAIADMKVAIDGRTPPSPASADSPSSFPRARRTRPSLTPTRPLSGSGLELFCVTSKKKQTHAPAPAAPATAPATATAPRWLPEFPEYSPIRRRRARLARAAASYIGSTTRLCHDAECMPAPAVETSASPSPAPEPPTPTTADATTESESDIWWRSRNRQTPRRVIDGPALDSISENARQRMRWSFPESVGVATSVSILLERACFGYEAGGGGVEASFATQTQFSQEQLDAMPLFDEDDAVGVAPHILELVSVHGCINGKRVSSRSLRDRLYVATLRCLLPSPPSLLPPPNPSPNQLEVLVSALVDFGTACKLYTRRTQWKSDVVMHNKTRTLSYTHLEGMPVDGRFWIVAKTPRLS